MEPRRVQRGQLRRDQRAQRGAAGLPQGRAPPRRREVHHDRDEREGKHRGARQAAARSLRQARRLPDEAVGLQAPGAAGGGEDEVAPVRLGLPRRRPRERPGHVRHAQTVGRLAAGVQPHDRLLREARLGDAGLLDVHGQGGRLLVPGAAAPLPAGQDRGRDGGAAPPRRALLRGGLTGALRGPGGADAGARQPVHQGDPRRASGGGRRGRREERHGSDRRLRPRLPRRGEG
mmetsp:Transcript_66123/g.173354  ORF Transcript_66123/g.173354 Transcript_66123/m.173354 type:complete len:232 (-) Transcript_66123:1308-2003(-)